MQRSKRKKKKREKTHGDPAEHFLSHETRFTLFTSQLLGGGGSVKRTSSHAQDCMPDSSFVFFCLFLVPSDFQKKKKMY